MMTALAELPAPANVPANLVLATRFAAGLVANLLHPVHARPVLGDPGSPASKRSPVYEPTPRAVAQALLAVANLPHDTSIAVVCLVEVRAAREGMPAQVAQCAE